MIEIKNLSEFIPGERYYLEIDVCREPGVSCRAKGLFTDNFLGNVFFENVESVNEKPLSRLFRVSESGELSFRWGETKRYKIYKPVDEDTRSRVLGSKAMTSAFEQVINKQDIPEHDTDPEVYKSLPNKTDLGTHLKETQGKPLLMNNLTASAPPKYINVNTKFTGFLENQKKGGKKSKKSKKSRKSRKSRK